QSATYAHEKAVERIEPKGNEILPSKTLRKSMWLMAGFFVSYQALGALIWADYFTRAAYPYSALMIYGTAIYVVYGSFSGFSALLSALMSFLCEDPRMICLNGPLIEGQTHQFLLQFKCRWPQTLLRFEVELVVIGLQAEQAALDADSKLYSRRAEVDLISSDPNSTLFIGNVVLQLPEHNDLATQKKEYPKVFWKIRLTSLGTRIPRYRWEFPITVRRVTAANSH
ncbi:hypothetical protein HYR69_07430, partial [Candidatus Sumerlaeota bacterium]|nr:hypothetical protein [Candidatus Sumerlaeota bacterium]